MLEDDVIAAARQRAGVLAELPGVLTGFGVDARVVFAAAGIDADHLGPDSRLPLPAILAVLDRAVSATGCPHLGLLLGLRFRFEHHGPIGRLMRAAPTLGEALRDFVFWQPGYSSGAVVYLIPQGDVHLFGYASLTAGMPGTRPLHEAVAAVGVTMIRQLTAGAVRPAEVSLSFPLHADPAIYARLLKAPIRQGEARTCLMLDRAAMATRLPGADPEARLRALDEAEDAMRRHLPDAAARVRQILRPLLQFGEADLAGAAGVLGLHPRTLRRRLAAEGATFSGLRDGVRYAMAREFLALTDIPVSEIAAAIGFASPGVFSETFRRWSGTSPTGWRRASATRTGGG